MEQGPRPEAERLGCLDEVQRARHIVERGTSADRQLAVYERARADGASEREATKAVVAWLIAETTAGLAPAATQDEPAAASQGEQLT